MAYIIRYILILFFLCFSFGVYASPQDGVVTAGSAAIINANNITTINQSSDKAIINWQNFDINADEVTNFVQPNKDAIALNRVISNTPSNIMGKLNANGNVWVINKKGVLFGANAEVNVGGLLVSTADINNSDFMAGNYKFIPSIDVNYSIINHGAIKIADNGLAILVAPGIENSGVIEANLGKIALASGTAFTLDMYGDNLIQFAVDSKITTPIYDLYDTPLQDAVKNTGTITAQGGKVLLTSNVAKEVVDNVINTSGVIEADTIGNKNGQIILYGTNEGKVSVDGALSARGKNTSENGGFIETSGGEVDIKTTALINASSADAIAGKWLIDPTDITVTDADAAGYNTILSGGTDIIITTAASGGGLGDITFNNTTTPIAWNTNANFTANAINNIIFNAGATINRSGGGTGTLTLRTDYDGSSVGTFSFSGVNLIVSASGTNSLFYNPTSGTYATPNNYTANISGTNWTAYMLVNDVGLATGGTTGLQAMNLNLSGNYGLGKDIDASTTSTWNSGAGFNPIGNSTTPFAGKLEGNYFTISDLYINRSGSNAIGLFGHIYGADFIRNMILLNPTIVGNYYVGSLVGECYGINLISNVAAINVNVRANLDAGGLSGIFGYNYGTLFNVFTTGYVGGISGTTFGDFGGLVAFNWHGTIQNCYSAARVDSISNAYNETSSLVGWNIGTIINSYGTGYATGSGGGGLVGNNTGTISNSYFDSNTTGRAGTEARTTSQMMQQANFSGWDFANTWGIISGTSYPYLKWYYPTTPTVISGTASGASGKLTRVALSGSNLQSTYTGVNGFYYQLEGTGLVNNSKVLVYLDDAISKGNTIYLADSLGTSVTDLNININGVTVRAYSSGTISSTDLITAKGVLASSNILYTNSGNDLSTSAGISFSTWSGTTFNINGNINTNTVGQTYNGPIILGVDTVLTSTGSGAINLAATVDSDATARNLTINTTGNTTFGGLVGDTNPFLILVTIAGGTTYINGGAVTTTGSQAYNDAVVLGANTILASTTAGAISLSGTINSDGTARSLTINTTGNTTFGGLVGASSSLLSLITDALGTTYINGGGVTTTGAQTYNDAVALGTATILTGSTFGFTTVDAASNALTLAFSATTEVDGSKFSNLQALTTQGLGKAQLKNIIQTTGAQTYKNTAIELVSNITLTSSAAGTIDLQGTVDSDATIRSLTINTTGNTIFGGLIGSTNALLSLVTNALGTTYINGGGITTTGAQTYNDAVVLGGNTVLAATSAGAINLSGTLNSDATARSLNINTTGNTTFGGLVGGTNALLSLVIDVGGTTYINGGGVTTTGLQTYSEPIVLGANTILASTAAGTISLSGALNSDATARSLAINTAGNTIFDGFLGGTSVLLSLVTDAGGTTYINGAGVATTGIQTYGDDVVLGANALLTGSTITFSGKVNSDATARILTVNTSGNTVYFEDFVGGVTPLDSLVVDTVGTIHIDGGGVTTIGMQTYNSDILLGTDAILTGSTFVFTTVDAGNQALTLDFSTVTEVDGAIFSNLQALTTQGVGDVQLKNAISTTGAQTYANTAIELVSNMILTSSGAGTIDLQGTVNSDLTTRSLTINTASDIIFGGLVGNIHALSNLIPNAGGTVYMDGGGITANYQTYNNPVVLGVDTNLNGINIDFNNTVNGQYNLTVTDSGLVTFLNEVGGITPLNTLTVNGAADINGTLIHTIGSQTYNGPVTLTTDMELIGNNITFNGTVDGPYRLTVGAGGGDVVFNQNVGAGTRLDGLIVVNPNNVTNNAAMYVGYYVQNTGTGTTNLGSLFDATGAIFIITDKVFGNINAGLLTLGSSTANMTGSISGQIKREAARRVLTLYKIAQGQYFFNGYDLFNIGPDDVPTSQVFIDVVPTYITDMEIPTILPSYEKDFYETSENLLDPTCNIITNS